MELISGLFILLVVLALPLRQPEMRQDPALRKATIAVLLAHQVVTALQVFVRPLPTVDVDPLSFNSYAIYGYGRVEGIPYAELLRFVYVWFGGSHFLGCQISNLGFALGMVMFVRLAYELGLKDVTPPLLLVFGLLPSLVLNTSVVMREGFQVAGFLGLAYGLLMLRRYGPESNTTTLLVGCTLGLLFLHNGFPPYLAGFLPLALLWATRSQPLAMLSVATGGFFVAALLGERIWQSLARRSTMLHFAGKGEGLDFIANYQKGVEKSRSEFFMTLDLSSISAFLISGPVVALEYLFGPMLWQVRAPMDLYAFFENVIRLALVWGAVAEFRRRDGESRRELLFLGLMFLSMELVWAAGTANWGTAFRHRVVAWGLLVLLGGPYILEKIGGGGVQTSARQSVRQGRDANQKLTRSQIRERRKALARDARPIPPPGHDPADP